MYCSLLENPLLLLFSFLYLVHRTLGKTTSYFLEVQIKASALGYMSLWQISASIFLLYQTSTKGVVEKCSLSSSEILQCNNRPSPVSDASEVILKRNSLLLFLLSLCPLSPLMLRVSLLRQGTKPSKLPRKSAACLRMLHPGHDSCRNQAWETPVQMPSTCVAHPRSAHALP